MPSVIEVRFLTEGDRDALLVLERAAWEPKGVETITPKIYDEWLHHGVLLGGFKEERLLGYAYGERIKFSPIPPYSSEIMSSIDNYWITSNNPNGNALHGVSMATIELGVGMPLLKALISVARSQDLQYFVSLARLAGFRRFVEAHPNLLRSFPDDVLATLYVMQTAQKRAPTCIGPSLSLLSLPDNFPPISRKDPTVGRFLRLGKEIWGVAKTSFNDPESLGYSALLVLRL